MPRNIFPFKISDDEPRTPLSVSPYNSRVVEHMLDAFDDAKNYKYVAFRPGYPLQAAELNEIQEYFYLEFSIIAFITNGWNAFSGAPNTYFDEGDLSSYAGPFWDGATPIVPYDQVAYGVLLDAGAIGPESIPAPINQIPELVDVIDQGETISVELKEGFYHASVTTGNEAVDNGFRYAIYYEPVPGTNVAEIEKREVGKTYVGFSMTQSYISPSQFTGETALTDPSLNDNSSGFTNDVAAGARRVKFNFNRVVTTDFPAGVFGGGSPVSYPQNCVVLYIDHEQKKVRYLNGLPVYVKSTTGLGGFGSYV